MKIPFNKSPFLGEELDYIRKSLDSRHIEGDGEFTKKCQSLMEEKFGAKKIFLTTSCTSGLEMSGILADIKPGDEIILPSFTFVSTVNAFILKGAKPVFVDIREDTLNIDKDLIESKITDKTKAMLIVHYAGVSCEMDKIMEIAKKYNITVIEDAAQGVNATYKEKYLGTIGDIGCYSFHGTKNYVCGEGGAIIINNENLIERAEIIRDKGTNRSKFLRGEIDKYTWVDVGASYLPSDILAAYLYPQLMNMDKILAKRKEVYDYYYENLRELETTGKIRLPIIPKDCKTNYHMFYVLFENEEKRNSVMKSLKEQGIQAVFHYVPLHTAPMGKSFGYKEGDLPITESISGRLLRLPFFYDITKDEQDYVIKNLKELI